MVQLLQAKTLELPVGEDVARDGESSSGTTALPPALSELRDRLASLRPNGSCIVTCTNGEALSAARCSCAVVLMKYTDKAQIFVSEGERLSLLDDLCTYFVDPPLADQLKPLATAELSRRAAAATAGAAPAPEGRDAALAATVAALAASPRRERHVEGRPVPRELKATLLSALRELRWPATSARPGVTSDHYLVFSTRRTAADLGTRHPHYGLRMACDDLLHWYRSACTDPGYKHTAIAVTKNFVGSPHIDTFDTCPQLALALGDYEGGALCVEGEGGGHVDVFDTHDRIAKVDGRRVHWVRAFRGHERFSLIFYNTADAEPLADATAGEGALGEGAAASAVERDEAAHAASTAQSASTAASTAHPAASLEADFLEEAAALEAAFLGGKGRQAF